MGIKPIALSFKNTPEDMQLYEWISSHSNMSGFVKDTLRAAKEEQVDIKNKKPLAIAQETGLIDMDF